MTTPPPAKPDRPSRKPEHPADSMSMAGLGVASALVGLGLLWSGSEGYMTPLGVGAAALFLGVGVVLIGGQIAAGIAKQHALWREGRDQQ